MLPTLRAAIEASGLRDGGTVSFHHHLRNGDQVINMVIEQIALMGITDITVAASSLFAVHAPLVEHIKSGVVGASIPPTSAVRLRRQSHAACCWARP
jgi:citrate lyase subunit alpha/citrate CoA-transferase